MRTRPLHSSYKNRACLRGLQKPRLLWVTVQSKQLFKTPITHGTYGGGAIKRHSKYSSPSLYLTIFPIAACTQLQATLPYFNTSSQYFLQQFVSAWLFYYVFLILKSRLKWLIKLGSAHSLAFFLLESHSCFWKNCFFFPKGACSMVVWSQGDRFCHP